MKTLSLSLPLLIVCWMFVAVWGLGMLSVKASATATQASIDLLRQQIRVARLRDQLLLHAQRDLETLQQQLAEREVSPNFDGNPDSNDTAAPGDDSVAPRPIPLNTLHPWPMQDGTKNLSTRYMSLPTQEPERNP